MSGDAIDLIALIGLASVIVVMIVVSQAQRRLAREQSRVIEDAQSDMISRILDPGSHPPPADGHDALRDFRAVWLQPNEEFIRETDRILNDIEWQKITSFNGHDQGEPVFPS